MPGPDRCCIISPVALVDECTSILGKTPTTSLYLESDTNVPRTETHRAVNGPTTTAQQAAIAAHIASPDPSLPGVEARLYVLPAPNPYLGMLTEMGLTNYDGS